MYFNNTNTSLFGLPEAFLFWIEHPNFPGVVSTFHQNPLFPKKILQCAFKETNQQVLFIKITLDWRKLAKRAFKRKIHKLLLTVLDIEDDYVDAHSLILNFKSTRIELS